MIINSSLTRLSVALIAAMGLSACHDHHHNSNNNDDGEVAVEVQVLDGALKGALVFADLNRNFELDREEAYVNTDENGRATLYIPKSSLKDSAGNDINSFRLFARSGEGDSDFVYGSETPLTVPVVLSREIFTANSSGLIAVTPFTTLTDMTLNPETIDSATPESYNSMLNEIATVSGAGKTAVTGGYNDSPTDENLHALVAGELLTRTGRIPGSLRDLEAVWNGSVETAWLPPWRTMPKRKDGKSPAMMW